MPLKLMHPQSGIPILPAGVGGRYMLYGGYGFVQYWWHRRRRHSLTNDNGFFLVPYESGYCYFFFNDCDE